MIPAIAAKMLLRTLAAFTLVLCTAAQGDFNKWTGWGANHRNNRWASKNNQVSSANINGVSSHCLVSFPIGVSATPVTEDDIAYFPTWNGSFAAVNYRTCTILWTRNITAIIADYKPITPFQTQNVKPISRSSPQVAGGVVFVGTLTHALVVALDKTTGVTLAIQQLNTHPAAVLTMSPTFFDGRLYIGAASIEENLTLDPSYRCCSFIGNMAALSFDATTNTFTVVWEVSMIPKSKALLGWSGAGLWGSQPAIDTKRRQVFVSTGNAYSVPNSTISCQHEHENVTYPPDGLQHDPCLPGDVWQDSVVAIALDAGTVNWVHQTPGLDAYTAGCGYPDIFAQNTTLCPQVPGPDADFGMAPTFVPRRLGGRTMVVVGRKNGVVYALSAVTGARLWETATSPLGIGGGLSWGIAADDRRVYFTAINSAHGPWALLPAGPTIERSAYGALNLSSGAVLWETPTPMAGMAFGPPSVVGDIVLVARTGQDPANNTGYDQTQGGLVAVDKATGKILMDHALETNFHGGVAVQNKFLLFGTGYSGFGLPALVPGGFHVMKVPADE
jgi:outer membrane protein assembly factor BamB